MKWVIQVLLALAFFAWATVSDAATPPTSSELQYFSSKQRLTNPGAELAVSTAQWVASAGTFARTTTSGEFRSNTGTTGFSFDAGATDQTVTSNGWVIGASETTNAYAFCYFKTTASDYLFEIFDGTNAISSQTIPALSTWTVVSTNFVASASTTYKIRVKSQSNAAEINWDDCYLGEAFNLANVSQTKLSVKATSAGGQAVAATTETKVTFESETWDLNGEFDPTTNYRYTAKLSGKMQFNVSVPISSAASEAFTLTLKKNGSSTVCAEGQTLSASAWTLKFTCALDVAKGDYFEVYVDSTADNSYSIDGGVQQVFEVFHTQAESMLAIDQQTTPMFASAYHGNDCAFTHNSVSFSDLAADASCTFTTRTSSNLSLSSQLSGSDKLPGITFTSGRAGTFEVCVSGSATNSTNSTYNSYRLSDGTNILATSVVMRQSVGVNNGVYPFRICGFLTVSSATSSSTVKIQGIVDAGSGTVSAAFSDPTALEWSVLNISQSFPAPVFIGGITSKYTGDLREAFLELGGASNDSNCTSDPCTIRNSSGDASGVARSAAGRFVVSWNSGTWSSDPVCVAMGIKHGSNVRMCGYDTNTTATLAIVCRDFTGAADDAEVQVRCIGPK